LVNNTKQKKIEFFQPTVQTLDYKIAYVRVERLKGLKAVCASSNKSWKKQNQHLITKWINNILISKLLCEIDIVKILQWIFFSQNVFVLFRHFKTSFSFFVNTFLLQKRTFLFGFSRTQKTLDNSTTLEISTRSSTFGKSLQFIWVGIEVIYSDLGSSFFQTCLLYFWIKFSFNILPWLDRFFTT